VVVAASLEVAGQQEELAPQECHQLELPLSSTYAEGATLLMATLADQTSLPWPDEFPRKFKEGANDQMEQVR
jgi:hypothetical protein